MTQQAENPYQPPGRTVSKDGARLPGLTVSDCAVIVTIIAVLMAVILPFAQNPREAVYRPQCLNNLKQVQLALVSYHVDYGSFPPAFITGADGQPAHSWRVLLLPYLDQQSLYDRYHFDEPWNGPRNAQLQDFMPSVYRCPRFLREVETDTPESQHLRRLANYSVIVSPHAVFRGAESLPISDLPDGAGNTIIVADVCQHAAHWMSPVDVAPHQLLTDVRLAADEATANHSGHLHVGFADSYVCPVPHDIPESDFYGLISIDGGEDVSLKF